MGTDSTPPATPSAELVVWDFDGTLADTFAWIFARAEAAVAPVLDGPCDRAVVRGAIGLPLTVMFERLLPGAPASQIAELEGDYRSSFGSPGGDEVPLFDGITGLLGRLDALGIRHAIATSRSHSTLDPMVDGLGIGPLFDVMVCGDDVTHHKPHPEMVELACNAVGVDSGQAMVIGDTVFDIEMGNRAAGATTVAVTWGNQDAEQLATAAPDEIVDDIGTLEEAINAFTSRSA